MSLVALLFLIIGFVCIWVCVASIMRNGAGYYWSVLFLFCVCLCTCAVGLAHLRATVSAIYCKYMLLTAVSSGEGVVMAAKMVLMYL